MPEILHGVVPLENSSCELWATSCEFENGNGFEIRDLPCFLLLYSEMDDGLHRGWKACKIQIEKVLTGDG